MAFPEELERTISVTAILRYFWWGRRAGSARLAAFDAVAHILRNDSAGDIFATVVICAGALRPACDTLERAMIIVMEHGSSPEAIDAVVLRLRNTGYAVQAVPGEARTILAIVGHHPVNGVELWRDLPGVEEVIRVDEPFRLASRRFRHSSTTVSGAWGTIGGEKPWLAIEPVGFDTVQEFPYEIAAGRPFDAAVVRGRDIPRAVGALVCLPLEHQPGAANDVAFVQRLPSWGADSWIGAAERELADGRGSVVLLETGGEYPNGARTLEIAAIVRAKLRTHLPIVVDASAIAQRSKYVAAVAQAAIAGGADGVTLRAWVGDQRQMPTSPATLPWDDAMALGARLRAIAAAIRD